MKVQLRVLVLLCAAFCAPSMWGMSDDEQKQLNRQLYAAADSGNKDRVLELLELKAQVNSGNRYGCTPLYRACWLGYTEIAELLVANKAAIDQATKFGTTSLYRACCEGHIEVVELLLANKAAIDQATKFGCTPLYRACYRGRIKIAELLLANGAAVDQKTKKGKTSLCVVCEKYNTNQNDARSHIIELLINGGADTQAVAAQFAGTAAGDLVAKLVQASPKGKRKRAKPSGFVDNAHSE